MELLLLGSLRYLGRGWTFDDCEESTAIDQDVHRIFFRVFLQFGSTVLYRKWVLTPVNLPEALSNMKEYSKAGLPGCVGSSERLGSPVVLGHLTVLISSQTGASIT